MRKRKVLTFVYKLNKGDGSGNVRCLRSCINQIKETEAETDTDAKCVLSPSRA